MTETEAKDLSRREPVSFRVSGYTFRDLEDWGRAEHLAPRTLAEDAVEAVLGYARCGRCSEAVPFDYGDLQGKPPSFWIEEARKQVRGQRCRDHQPVPVGVTHRARRKAAAGKPRRPAPAVFLEPGARGQQR